jgi:rubrerythrin
MNGYDPKLAARVWQRVQKAPETAPDTAQLMSLIAQEWTDAATYLSLSRRTHGRISAQLHHLYEEEQAHIACLKGIYTLVTGTRPATRSVPPSNEPVELVLRRCYGREMQCLAQYEARSADPEYGPIFARLAAQEREHCRLVLEILGSLQERR